MCIRDRGYCDFLNYFDASIHVQLTFINQRANMQDFTYWYEEAAMQTHATAQYNLGWCYENGFGVQPNIDKALVWRCV